MTENEKVAPLKLQEINELTDILMSLQRCFMFSLSKELARGKVSFSQFFLLGHLLQNGHLTMSQIADKMGHTTAAATGLVDRLENLKYVTRSHDKADRRKVLVAIKPKGSALVQNIRDDMTRNLEQIMKELSPQEQATWLAIYRKVYSMCHGK